MRGDGFGGGRVQRGRSGWEGVQLQAVKVLIFGGFPVEPAGAKHDFRRVTLGVSPGGPAKSLMYLFLKGKNVQCHAGRTHSRRFATGWSPQSLAKPSLAKFIFNMFAILTQGKVTFAKSCWHRPIENPTKKANASGSMLL